MLIEAMECKLPSTWIVYLEPGKQGVWMDNPCPIPIARKDQPDCRVDIDEHGLTLAMNTKSTLVRITDDQFLRVAHYLPLQRGNVRLSSRSVIEAVLYVRETGCAWNKLPGDYGHWHTIYTRARRWSRNGVLDLVMKELGSIEGMVAVSGASKAARPPSPGISVSHVSGAALPTWRLRALADELRPVIFGLSLYLKNERSHFKLSQMEVATLMAIEATPGISISTIAVRLEWHPATMSLAIRRLAEKGWIYADARAPEDKRRAYLTISEAGRQVLHEVRAGRSDQLIRQFIELSPENFHALEISLVSLKKICKGLSRAMPIK